MTIDRLDASVVLALAVALLGVIPAAWIWATQPAPTSATVPASISVPAEASVVETITETVTTEPIVVDGLDESVTSLLQEEGFLGRVDATAPEVDGLAPSVIAVLRAHDVVLKVAEAGTAP